MLQQVQNNNQLFINQPLFFLNDIFYSYFVATKRRKHFEEYENN
jgi:hypothetical protein